MIEPRNGMTYSNEDFEAFQERLLESTSGSGLLWELRDALFTEAFYGKPRNSNPLLILPGVWRLKLQHERLLHRKATPATPTHGAIHVMFLSARNNHVQRLIPTMCSDQSDADFQGWIIEPRVLGMLPKPFAVQSRVIAGAWTKHSHSCDYRNAHIFARDLADSLPGTFDGHKIAVVCAYMVRFFGWQRFWQMAFSENTPQSVITTYEKAEHAKAMLYVAKQLGVPHRIHWIHGLRHASLQASLATELWCMTPGDVRFFRSRVPSYCTPIVKENPEATALAQSIGVLDSALVPALNPVHFLFLGPGKEKSYPKDMRMADLAVIHKLQQYFGSKIQWRFRPHPSATDRFQSELAEAGINASD
jgi:hypothetical protein